jgi:16S rRNA (cytosine967-C5)-methyltransferase
MDRIPVSAACNESVTLAKRYGHSGSSGFVNAVLRNISRGKDKIGYPDEEKEPLKYLSVKYSYPEWMVEKYLNIYGKGFTESLLSAGNAVPEVTVRVNTLRTSREELIEELKKDGVEARPGKYSQEAVTLTNPSSLSRLSAFKKGLFQVQDESSMLAGLLLDPKPGELVIDVCSAPGGKATHMAQLMENKGIILARDIHEHKIKLIDEAAQRLGISIIKTEIFDASQKDEKNYMKADRVLLDAPCSGLGIIRKKPDIKWTRTAEETSQLPELQDTLIEAAAGSVKPGGVLVYSTCTILPDENQKVVERFLKRHTEFELDDITGLIPGELREYTEKKGMINLFPNRDGIDGFFMARMIRRS